MWEVDIELVKVWLDSLDRQTYGQVAAAFKLLARQGPNLGRPIVDSIVGSRYKNMKELRPGSTGRSEIRILFVFDPTRRAVLLLGGDKAGKWSQWYRRNVPRAEKIYDEYLRRQGRK